MNENLIYDVGLHDGSDTAYYLFKGFRVVAIEANSTLVEAAQQRFAKELAEKRLDIVNVAIAPQRGRAEFWICEQKSEWSSFSKTNATKQGTTAHCVPVECVPFRDVLGTYGVPYYLKVDIEGHDEFCIADLERSDLPQYVSVELGEGSAETMLGLRRLGYDRFKIIQQNDHTQLAAAPLVTKPSRLRRLAGLFASGMPEPPLTKGTIGGWTFPFGSSGPFGEETDGNWQTLEEALEVCESLGNGAWADVHASRSSA